ncbi:MAG: 4-(cytidine 5'-diphospho)-2-C-methyl-D-erythritol kinase [Pseudomonadota bacterium]
MASPHVVTQTARAKVNLALHVTGQRADGYHLLDSIVAFAQVDAEGGDQLAITFDDPKARPPTLTVDGPFASEVPTGAGNSALDAALLVGGIASVKLTKNLPVAAGIGGGSADAAAVLRAVAFHRAEPLSHYSGTALCLGADVPVCLHERAVRMQGIGDVLTPFTCPPIPAVLINPRVPMPTPAVFRALSVKSHPPLPDIDGADTPDALMTWLKGTRNDLQPPAEALSPKIAEAVAAMSTRPGCVLARMTGSGATVFGLFQDHDAQQEATAHLKANHPDWWVRSALLSG